MIPNRKNNMLFGLFCNIVIELLLDLGILVLVIASKMQSKMLKNIWKSLKKNYISLLCAWGKRYFFHDFLIFFIVFRPCEHMRNQGFAGRNSLHPDSPKFGLRLPLNIESSSNHQGTWVEETIFLFRYSTQRWRVWGKKHFSFYWRATSI